jgi:hypothetical protein
VAAAGQAHPPLRRPQPLDAPALLVDQDGGARVIDGLAQRRGSLQVLHDLPVPDGLQGGAVLPQTLLQKTLGFCNESGLKYPVHPLVDSAN